MLNPLLEPFDPLTFVRNNHRILGCITLSTFHRLVALIDSSSIHRDVEFDLEFGAALHGLNFIHGGISTKIAMVCQRCGNPVEFDINCVVRLGIVKSLQQINTLPDKYEPLVLDLAGDVSLIQIVEDEILLALPDIARHEEGQCEINARYLAQDLIDEKPDNPFDVLSKLKNRT